MAEPILHIEGLDKKIGSKQILKQISMDVMEGEIIGLSRSKWFRKNNTHPYHRRAAETKQRKRDNQRIPA